MSNILVVASADVVDRLAGALPPGVRCAAASRDEQSLAELQRYLATASVVVVCLDGLSDAATTQLERLLSGYQGASVVVTGQPWDGFTPLPLARTCRAVVAGFGDGAAVTVAMARWWWERDSAREP